MKIPSLVFLLAAMSLGVNLPIGNATVPARAAAHGGLPSKPENGPVIDSDSGRFHLEFPAGFAAPTFSATPVPTAVGTVRMTTAMSQQDENHVCMIAYADYPEDAVTAMGKDTRKVLEAAQDKVVKDMKAALLWQQDIRIDGILGRSFRFISKAGAGSGYGQFNIYLVGARMYQICYISTDKKQLDRDEIKAYFNSFKLK